jgi:LDH2 family malate/lactate/ureidoglycolate dehydrogenase
MAVKYTKVNEMKLVAFSTKVLEKLGMPHDDGFIASRLMVNTDLRGIASHGVAHLNGLYVKRLKSGFVKAKPDIKMYSGAPATAVIDGDRGLGFVVGHKAMQEAIARAKVTGIGAVTCRNTTHYGACSAYSLLALPEDMIGFSCTTGGLNAVAPGASGRTAGMNAMSFAAPSNKEFPFCLDMSSTMAAWGKVEIALRTGDMLPLGWTVDTDGNPITDPKEDEKKKGAMVMLGGTKELGVYKGFGLNLMIDILSSTLAASVCLPELFQSPSTASTCTHFCAAMKISGFTPPEEFKKGMDRLIETYHNLPKAKGVKNITIPGELEWALVQDRKMNGIPLDEVVMQSLQELSAEFKVDFDIVQK